MAIDLSTSPGGLFRRWGKIVYALRSANRYLGSTDLSAGGLKAVGVSTTDILGQFLSTLQNVPDGIYAQRDSARAVLSSWKSYLQSLAVQTAVQMADADAVLVSRDTATAVQEIITQMVGSGTIYNADNDVDANTVSAAVTPLTANTGTGVVAASVVRSDGRNNELVFAETIEVRLAGDAPNGATARSEPCVVLGEVAVSDPLDQAWPAGSGASTSLTVIDCDLNANGNLLYNSNFETTSPANTFSYWGAPLVGVYGTDILEEATVVNRAGKSLRFKGDGATLSSIAQSFAAASVSASLSGTTSTLAPDTVYAVSFWARKTAGALAGAVQVRLLDASNVQTTDDAGTNNLVTEAVGSLSSAAWTNFVAFFRTPRTALPTTAYKLNVRLSTAVTNTESIYVDDLAVCEATQAYAGGPYLAAFAGATNFLLGDLIKVVIANDLAGDFQVYLDRLLGMRELGLQFPSDAAAGETLLDSWIA